MSSRWVFSGVGTLALLAGLALWIAGRPAPFAVGTAVAPGALLAATFTDTRGQARSLGQFQGKILVVNFWATWCAPCREEMPGFTRLQSRWGARNVQFVGLTSEDPQRVESFAKALGISYPLWVGGDQVGELSKRLGNHLGVLPHTVLVDEHGKVLESRVGPYTEALLEARLSAITH